MSYKYQLLPPSLLLLSAHRKISYVFSKLSSCLVNYTVIIDTLIITLADLHASAEQKFQCTCLGLESETAATSFMQKNN